MKIAIVTGASSGMGKDFARKLDGEGLDEIWVVAKHEDGLLDLKNDLKTKTKILTFDLSNLESIDEIQKEIENNKATVMWLVNCAGFGKFNSWENIRTETSLNMIDLNCKAVVKLTDICIPNMTQGSWIVNFSSVAAFQPVPYANIYAATKAFLLSYSRALSYELKSRKISVTCVCPYWTKTKFFDRAVSQENKVVKKYVVMYDSEKVVRKAYKDSLKRKRLSIYGFVSNAQVFLTKLFPASFVDFVWLKQQKLDKKPKNKQK